MLDLFEPTWTDVWNGRESQESFGAVFTRPEIVDLILDLIGYRLDRGRLASIRLLEPSCGDGAFILRIVQRLVESERRVFPGGIEWMDRTLDHAVRGVDINAPSITSLRLAVADLLMDAGCPSPRASALAGRWLFQADFLLHDWTGPFDVIVGNPPYVRIEELPKNVLQRYRSLYATLGDRADLYVAFIERGLQLLTASGVLGFITANRFAKNLYGRGLRKLIAERYRVRYFLNLEHTQPFESNVSAYPAITVLDRQQGASTRAGSLKTLNAGALSAVRNAALADRPTDDLHEFDEWYPDGGPWVTTCRTEHRRLHALQARLVSLEASAPGTRVGIGVATGADRVFVLKRQDPEIELDRQIPLVLAADLSNQDIRWSGHVLLNPFAASDDGSLADLELHPGLRAYLLAHRDQLAARHVARGRPLQWYRTIDRVWPELQRRAKLLIPDIQPARAPVVALDEGKFYPHHNLYWITSGGWDLRALKSLLRSSMVLDQVRAYSVQMRGGSLRWQAQTLRKVILPPVHSLRDAVLCALRDAADSADQREIDAAAEPAFHT